MVSLRWDLQIRLAAVSLSRTMLVLRLLLLFVVMMMLLLSALTIDSAQWLLVFLPRLVERGVLPLREHQLLQSLLLLFQEGHDVFIVELHVQGRPRRHLAAAWRRGWQRSGQATRHSALVARGDAARGHALLLLKLDRALIRVAQRTLLLLNCLHYLNLNFSN